MIYVPPDYLLALPSLCGSEDRTALSAGHELELSCFRTILRCGHLQGFSFYRDEGFWSQIFRTGLCTRDIIVDCTLQIRKNSGQEALLN